ncbi:pentapeptide repeat-containing protein [Rugosimonospora africana]|uniref:Pentapeptide repeat-containing protein n=1 Tax=Rugosimonospora africana TaxID=556532 RepID=A0A8J3R1D2_9ACTN|nr:pentapeptide repeat-containing protein [Rugosimonospora africana]GIH19817.1 hypothetical protein Raf01_79890 [Rugosimonospora africana]
MPARSRTTARRAPATRAQREPRKPVPPSALTTASLDEHDLTAESGFERLGFADLDLSERRAGAVEFSQCRFDKATLSGSELPRLGLTDCLIENCDWANLRAEGGKLDRVRVAESRMTGLTWTDGLVRDALFDRCRMDLSVWRFADFDTVRFSHCNLAGADFTNADLRTAQFVECDLTRAQFSNATMEGTRFRGCTLVGIAGVTSWSGAVVHHSDLLALSYALAAALNIRIDED